MDDTGLSLLNDHPNIELRIFNPIARKGVYAFNYVGNFNLANRRMHNKSFTVDNQVAIVGGRNIAVEYFQLETSGEFIDFDMLVSLRSHSMGSTLLSRMSRIVTTSRSFSPPSRRIPRTGAMICRTFHRWMSM